MKCDACGYVTVTKGGAACPQCNKGGRVTLFKRKTGPTVGDYLKAHREGRPPPSSPVAKAEATAADLRADPDRARAWLDRGAAGPTLGEAIQKALRKRLDASVAKGGDRTEAIRKVIDNDDVQTAWHFACHPAAKSSVANGLSTIQTVFGHEHADAVRRVIY